MKDYYKTLGVSEKAGPGEIRERYRALVTSCHPDKFQGACQKRTAEERIKEVNEAYEALCDPQRRAAYDRQRAVRRSRRSPRIAHPATAPTPFWGEFAQRSPVTPVASFGEPSGGFHSPASSQIPHLQRKIIGSRGDILRIWLDCRANILLLTNRDYTRYLKGASFAYLGGYARVSPIDLAIPQNGRWRLVIDLGGRPVELGVKVHLLTHPREFFVCR